MSLLVVSALAATGLTNSYFLVGSLPALVTSEYGRLLTLKLFLFFIMIAFGAYNFLRLKPQLAIADEQNAKERNALRKLMRNVIAELCLGMIVVLIVGALEPLRRRAIACNETDRLLIYRLGWQVAAPGQSSFDFQLKRQTQKRADEDN